MTLPSGITTHYDFSDGSGTTITDIVGGKNASLSGGGAAAFWSTTDRLGDPVGKFNGSNQRVIGPSTLDYPTGDWTFVIVMSFNPAVWTVGGNTRQRFFEWFETNVGGTTMDWNRGLSPPSLRFRSRNGVTNHDSDIELVNYLDVPLVIVLSYDSTAQTQTLQINQKVVTTTSVTVAAPATSANLALGAQNDGNNAIPCRMWNVLIYDGKALSSTEKDQVFEHFRDGRLRGPSPTINLVDSQVNVDVYKLPNDGISEGSVAQIHSAIQTNASGTLIAVADTHYEGLVNQVHVHAWVWTIGASWAPGTPTPDGLSARPFEVQTGDGGHRMAGVGWDADGFFHIHKGTHNEPFDADRSDNPDTIVPFSSVTTPSYLSANAITYPTYWRRPSTNQLFWVARENGGQPSDTVWVVAEVNLDTGLYDQLNGANFWRVPGAEGGEIRSMFLTEGLNGDVYCSAKKENGQIKAKGHSTRVIKSTDGMINWSTLDGDALSQPFNPDISGSHAFPRTHPDADALDPQDDVITVQMAVDNDGVPHLFCRWRNLLEGGGAAGAFGDLWYARWDSRGQHFIPFKLVTATTEMARTQQVFYDRSNDNLYCQYGEDINGGNIYLIVSNDGGQTFYRYKIADAAQGRSGNGCRFDQSGWELQGKFRTVMTEEYGGPDNPTYAEVWEYTPPALEPARTIFLLSPEYGLRTATWEITP